MPNINHPSRVFTTSYSYGAANTEHIFTCKGRPFAALVSHDLPTPTTSLVDYALIKELGLKLSDVQYRKFSFSGEKMRIMGRISTAVQCVQNGKSKGNFHIKGLVVTNLYNLFDTDCVAGTKMRNLLTRTRQMKTS